MNYREKPVTCVYILVVKLICLPKTQDETKTTPVGKDIGNKEDEDKNKEEETKLKDDPLAKPPKIVKPKTKTADKPVVSNKPKKKTDSSVKKPAPVKPVPSKPVPVKPQQKTNKK